MTTGKVIVLTIQTFVGKEYLCFLMRSGFVIAFLPRSKCLNFCLQSPSTEILEPKKIVFISIVSIVSTVSIVSPSICHEVLGSDALILVFEC